TFLTSGFVIPFVIRHSCFVIFDVLISARMKLVEISALEFDLAMALNSGQVFHWQRIGDGFVGTIGERSVYVEQGGNVLRVRDGEPPSPTRGPRALRRIVARYFALDHPLGEICDSFPKDPVMNAARDFCHG